MSKATQAQEQQEDGFDEETVETLRDVAEWDDGMAGTIAEMLLQSSDEVTIE